MTDTKIKNKRERLSVDLEFYPDVKAAMAKAEKAWPGSTRTAITINALRPYLKKHGFLKYDLP